MIFPGMVFRLRWPASVRSKRPSSATRTTSDRHSDAARRRTRRTLRRRPASCRYRRERPALRQRAGRRSSRRLQGEQRFRVAISHRSNLSSPRTLCGSTADVRSRGVVEEITAAGGEALADTSSVAEVSAAEAIVAAAIDAFGRASHRSRCRVPRHHSRRKAGDPRDDRCQCADGSRHTRVGPADRSASTDTGNRPPDAGVAR